MVEHQGIGRAGQRQNGADGVGLLGLIGQGEQRAGAANLVWQSVVAAHAV